ncbi:hypothetical protein C2S52_003351 [Perilla frutescens var. hirtella]|nr:hypothetical protein C2S51_012149 [Perilla frutescens var. frutescens]KAH6792874.1 hypothetical protein C2S52_003351 [Perilla frutescens var. hirtella]
MSSTTEVCFNSNCKETSEKWRRGWRRRTGEYAHLCDRCASAYEDGKFCETFHMNASGWRCCESCGKQIHCGCIVSFHMFVLLDAGGIECLTCAKKSYILTPNPAWPPPLHFLPSQPERMKDLSVKTWSAIAGSGPVPWRQAPSLFNGSSVQANVQLRMPFEIDVSGGIDRYGVCERLSMASPEIKHERSYERLANGKLRLGPSETLQNGNMGLNGKEHCPLTNDFKPIFPRKDASSNLNLGISSSSKNEIDDVPVSAILSQSPPVSVSVGKKVCSQSGMDSSGDAQIRNGKSRVDGRSRNQLLPRYRPQITDEELQQISGDSKSAITPLFEKMLSASDAGRIGRLVLPKKCAEAYFPPISHPEGLPLKVQDVKGKEWVFQFRFWPNNNSRMYVLEGITPCIQSMHLQAGDVVTFSRLEPEGKLIMGGRKASAVPSLDQGEEVIVIGSEASSPADGSARNKSADVISVNGHMKEKILDDKPVTHVKRKNSNLNAKSKRLRIENEDTMELKLTYKEAQGLMRAPAKIVPSSFVVDGCEFEEFEEAEPIIGRPVILGIDHAGEKIQWVQCEDCFKWRKVPADALVPSKWTCSDNVWDLHRSLCSSAEELTIEQLEQMLHAMNKGPCNKEESSGRDADMFVALEGLDALANLAIQGEGEGLLASSENRTKHPRHKPGCTCIVCLQPPSGKGIKHEESCYCVVCNSLKRRFRTLLERKGRKQLEKETESSSSSQNLQSREKEQDIDACPGSGAGNQEEARKLSTSAVKGQIDLNIQPEREEDFSPRSDCGTMKCLIPGSAERFFRQQRPLEPDVIGNLLGKQDGVGCVNIRSCVALEGGAGGHKKTG